jgi:hypothetical protein
MNVNIALLFHCLLWQKLNMNNSGDSEAREMITCEGIFLHNSSLDAWAKGGKEGNAGAGKAESENNFNGKIS